MGAEGTGVANEAVGPIDTGIELPTGKTSELEFVSEEPEASMERFSKISNGED